MIYLLIWIEVSDNWARFLVIMVYLEQKRRKEDEEEADGEEHEGKNREPERRAKSAPLSKNTASAL